MSSMLLELIECGHDDGLAEWTEVLGDRERAVNMRYVTIVGLNLVKAFDALFTLHFVNEAFMGDVSFSPSKFLKV